MRDEDVLVSSDDDDDDDDVMALVRGCCCNFLDEGVVEVGVAEIILVSGLILDCSVFLLDCYKSCLLFFLETYSSIDG